MTDDIKELLGKAFTQEPPLRIDRDEVLQEGRKRLRRRRVFEAGSVVAAVVVAAVGAAALTNLGGGSEPNRLPPAASTTTVPAPSSQMPTPRTTAETSTTTFEPPSSSESARAQAMTNNLRKSGFLAPFGVQPMPGQRGEPTFVPRNGVYIYEADLYGPDGQGGFLQIRIDYAPGKAVDCTTIPTDFFDCEVKGAVATARWKSDDGELQNYAGTVLDDGTRIEVLSSNMTMAERMTGQPQAGAAPLLDTAILRALVTTTGFSVH
jgi:hypothetical protein